MTNHPKTLQDALEMFDEKIQKHKDKACVIADASEYDEVNMPNFVENPVVRNLVLNHIDSARELSYLKSFLTTIWHAGRESVVEEITHEQKKLLDGFSHDPKCEMCKLSELKEKK